MAEGTGLGLAYVTAALLGHPLPETAAKVIGKKLDLDADSVARLQIIPLHGSLSGVPTDPTIQRFYEMIQIYGTTLKPSVLLPSIVTMNPMKFSKDFPGVT